MNARFAQVLSRVSLVSLVTVSAIGAAACNGRASTSTPAPAVAAEATPEASPEAKHTPGQHVFKQVYALDLRPEQRAAVSEAEQNLIADLTPHREALRQVVEVLASGIESGRLDPSDAAAQKAALAATVADVRAALATAMNSVHDTLDAGQRAALVAQLEEQHKAHAAAHAPVSGQHGPLGRLAMELGLSEEQKQTLRDAIQQGADEIFPDRKARREASEARVKALATAFVSDDFDAADHELAPDAERSLESFTDVATRAVDVSGRVLSASQRQLLAATLRSKSVKL